LGKKHVELFFVLYVARVVFFSGAPSIGYQAPTHTNVLHRLA
jgi:hypothetical protein